jgi:hypothetical protein
LVQAAYGSLAEHFARGGGDIEAGDGCVSHALSSHKKLKLCKIRVGVKKPALRRASRI